MSARIDIEAAEWPCCETGEPCPRHYWLTDVSGKEVGPFLRPTAPTAPEPQTAPETAEGMGEHVWVCEICGRHREDEGIRGCNPIRGERPAPKEGE